MVTKAKIALGFVLGASYASLWWASAMFNWGTNGILIVPVVISTILLLIAVAVSYINHWDDK